METKKWFKVPQCSAVKIVNKFNQSANLKSIIKFPIRNLFLFTGIHFTLSMAPIVHKLYFVKLMIISNYSGRIRK
jgi:hypothetical protein